MVYKHYSNKYVKNFKNYIDYKTKNKIFTHYNIIYKNINLNSNFKQNFFNYGVLKFFKNYHKYKTWKYNDLNYNNINNYCGIYCEIYIILREIWNYNLYLRNIYKEEEIYFKIKIKYLNFNFKKINYYIDIREQYKFYYIKKKFINKIINEFKENYNLL